VGCCSLRPDGRQQRFEGSGTALEEVSFSELNLQKKFIFQLVTFATVFSTAGGSLNALDFITPCTYPTLFRAEIERKNGKRIGPAHLQLIPLPPDG
jgi:hypothetical protein